MKDQYCLQITKNNKELKLSVHANDASHAQAQSLDISRSLKANKFQLIYSASKESKLSKLFKRLAFSDFKHKECHSWDGSFLKNTPILYTLGCRYYVRPLILDYMDMNRDNFVHMACGCSSCINPYHNSYKANKASKLTGGDLKLVVAYRSQGISVTQIAKALNVHRSTIYRNLTHECFPAGS
jgi:hypothetical protein